MKIKQWKTNRIKLIPNQTLTYNTKSELTNIFQIINRQAVAGGTVFVDTEPSVSSSLYQLRVDPGSSQNLILPYAAKTIYLRSTAAVPITITVVEITSDDISFVFGSAQLVNISGQVQVQEPITIDGTVGIAGEVEIKNDSGNPVPVSGTVSLSSNIVTITGLLEELENLVLAETDTHTKLDTVATKLDTMITLQTETNVKLQALIDKP